MVSIDTMRRLDWLSVEYGGRWLTGEQGLVLPQVVGDGLYTTHRDTISSLPHQATKDKTGRSTHSSQREGS